MPAYYVSSDYLVERDDGGLWGGLWEFETAHDVAVFMWGRDFEEYRIYKRGKHFEWTDGNLAVFEAALEAF